MIDLLGTLPTMDRGMEVVIHQADDPIVSIQDCRIRDERQP